MDKRNNRLSDRFGKMERVHQHISDRHDNLHVYRLQNRDTIRVNDNFMAYLLDDHRSQKGKKINMVNCTFTSFSAGGKPLKTINVSSSRMQRKIRKLQKKNHLGSELINWNNFDLSAGKGILNELDRCYWTIEGKRINIIKSAICKTKTIYQSWNIDPFYPKLTKNKFKRN